MVSLKNLRKIIRLSLINFKSHKPIQLAGTLAFFTIFAIPPILLIIINVIGFFAGEELIRGNIYLELRNLIGAEGADLIQSIMLSYEKSQRSVISIILSIFMFIFASSTFFIIIQNSLNSIWQVKPKPKHNFLKFLTDRLLSFGMIMSLGFLFLVSLVLDAAVAFLANPLQQMYPDITLTILLLVNSAITFVLYVIVFAFMFKFLPDVHITWKVAKLGGIITSILFMTGKLLIAFGISQTNIGDLYGTVGSIVILLLWVFYSALILFLGAEITQQYAFVSEKYKAIRPKNHAVRVVIQEIEDEEK